ncbi:protein PIN-LIKES 7-like [Nymphaea colorata]|nr:protein PIN-LIKES 7-like [Nymphaea colorata]
MGFWTLFAAASAPIQQVILIGGLGAFLATKFCNVLTVDARRHLNKVVFTVFTPSLMFASLAQSVTFDDIISWWFMPINIGLTFLIGGLLGWAAVKLLKPPRQLEGLIVACCSSGNLGNLFLIILPTTCNEDGTPFGDSSSCVAAGMAYSSFSMALGAFYIWTFTFHLMSSMAVLYREVRPQEAFIKMPNAQLDSEAEAHLLMATQDLKPEQSSESVVISISLPPSMAAEGSEQSINAINSLTEKLGRDDECQFWENTMGFLETTLEKLMVPPTAAAIIGLVVGAIPSLKSLIIGDFARLHVVQQSISLLGNGTIPSIMLILGGNLTEGVKSGMIKVPVVLAILSVRYVILPVIGIATVRFAAALGFLSPDPLYHYILMLQFTVPPAMNLSTMAQLINVGEQECSVMLLWAYLVAALALTVWSTIYMWILT